MRNRVKGAWRSLRGRRFFSLAAVGGIAALLLGTLGASTAVAHGTVTSGEIANQTIRSIDIHAGGVGQSEIREDGVDWSEIENQSIQSFNIGAEEVGTSEIRDGTIRNEDLSDEVQTGQGPPGPEGPQGPPGPPGISEYEVDGFYKPVTANGQIATVTANCAAGKFALGGGYSVEFDRDLVHVEAVVASNFADFEPIQGDPEGSVRAKAWEVRVQLDNSGAQFNVRPWVACAVVE